MYTTEFLATTTAASGGETPVCEDADVLECQAKKRFCSNLAYKALMMEKCPATCGFCSSSDGVRVAAVVEGEFDLNDY